MKEEENAQVIAVIHCISVKGSRYLKPYFARIHEKPKDPAMSYKDPAKSYGPGVTGALSMNSEYLKPMRTRGDLIQLRKGGAWRVTRTPHIGKEVFRRRTADDPPDAVTVLFHFSVPARLLR